MARFSKADAAAVVGTIFVLGLVMLPTIGADNGGLGRARELSNRTYCAANLRGIGQSVIVYGADNNDMYPLLMATSATTYDVSDLAPDDGKATADDTITAMYSEKKHQNDPMAALWLLVLKNMVTPKQFICKSDPFVGKAAEMSDTKTEKFYTNFQDGKNFSYSMAYPWIEDKQGKVVVGLQWKSNTDSSLPIMSDMAPYVGTKAKPGEKSGRPVTSAPATREDNVAIMGHGDVQDDVTRFASMNHQYQGETVMYQDAHAEFARRPDVGQNNDNIWTQNVEGKETVIEAGELPQALTAENAPVDVVMVPTRTAKGEMK